MRSRFVIFILVCLLLPRLALAVVAVDTNASAFSAGDAASVTLSSYAVTGSNTLALCGVSVLAGPDAADPTSVTFNSVPMTLVTSQNPFANQYYSLWYMTGVSGTHDFVLSVAPHTGYMGIGCATFTGVDPTTPLGTAVIATWSSNITVTVPANGMAADFAGNHPADCTDSLAPGTAGQTALYAACATMALNVSVRGSYRTTSGAFTWSLYYVQIGVPINPVAAAGAVTRRRIIQ